MPKKFFLSAAFLLLAAMMFSATPALAINSSWSQPEEISDLMSSGTGQVAVGANGHTAAVWAAHDSNFRSFLQIRTTSNGLDWSDTIDLTDPSLGSAASPQLAVDSFGRVTVAWTFEDGTNLSVVQATTSGVGGVWPTPPVILNLSSPSVGGYGPQVVVDNSDRVTVVWPTDANAELLVQSVTSGFNSAWPLTPVVTDLSSPADGEANDPQVAVDSSGRLSVVWQSIDSSDIVIKTVTSGIGGVWPANPSVTSLSSPVDGEAGVPQVAVDSVGKVSAVWATDSNGDLTVQTVTSRAGGVWTAPLDVKDLTEPGNGDPEQPRIGVDSSGRITVLWLLFNNPFSVVQAATSDAGGIWPDAVQLTTLSSGDIQVNDPRVAADGNGLTIAVWGNFTEGVIETRTSLNGGAWSQPQLLTSPNRGEVPLLSVNQSGLAAVVFNNLNGSDRTLYFSSLDSRVAPTPPSPVLPATGGGATNSLLLFGGIVIALLGGAITALSHLRNKSQ